MICYEDIKGNAKCRICGAFGWLLGVTWSHRHHVAIRYSTYDFLIDFHRNCASIFYRFQVMASYWSKVANFNLSQLYLAPPLGMIPFEYGRDIRHQKTGVLGYREALFAFSRFSRTPTCDRRTDGQTGTWRQLIPALASVARVTMVHVTLTYYGILHHQQSTSNHYWPISTLKFLNLPR